MEVIWMQDRADHDGQQVGQYSVHPYQNTDRLNTSVLLKVTLMNKP